MVCLAVQSDVDTFESVCVFCRVYAHESVFSFTLKTISSSHFFPLSALSK